MLRVLVVDDDPGTQEGFALTLRRADFAVLACGSLDEARRSLHDQHFDVVLADLRLPDGTGIDLVRTLDRDGSRIPVVIVTGFGSVPIAVEAMRAGAVQVVEKPLIGDALVAAVHSALSSPARAPSAMASHNGGAHADVVTRWSMAVCAVIDAKHDPNRVSRWASIVGVAPETLRTWCRVARLPVKGSLDLARVLRGVIHARLQSCRPEDLLDVAHPRTIRRLLFRGGIAAVLSDAPTIDDVLDRQQFISNDVAILELRQLITMRDPPHLLPTHHVL